MIHELFLCVFPVGSKAHILPSSRIFTYRSLSSIKRLHAYKALGFTAEYRICARFSLCSFHFLHGFCRMMINPSPVKVHMPTRPAPRTHSSTRSNSSLNNIRSKRARSATPMAMAVSSSATEAMTMKPTAPGRNSNNSKANGTRGTHIPLMYCFIIRIATILL